MVIGLIQVRMGSTRLPGKSLMEINGKPMLWHLIKRVEKSKLIDKIVIATTVEKQDDAIEEFAKKEGIDCFRGSEMDIMDRLYNALKAFNGDIGVRITGDCPLVDHQVIDKLIGYYLEHKDEFDIVTNIFPPTHPQGLSVEVFPREILERALNEMNDPFWREWVTVYFYENPDKYRVANIKNEENFAHHRWTVDYEEDYKFVDAVFSALGPNGEDFTMEDILKFLVKHDEIYNLNRGFKRNESFGEIVKEKGIKSEWYKTQS